MAYYTCKYTNIRAKDGGKEHRSGAGTVSQQSETMVMQDLKKKHKGDEIILTKLEWK